MAAPSDGNAEHRERRRQERQTRTVEHFKASSRGLRRVFERHFPESSPEVEAIVYHLASAEAKLPSTREAIRLARYPGAGDRDPRRFALGLWENLSVLHRHLEGALESLEKLGSRPGNGRAAREQPGGTEL